MTGAEPIACKWSAMGQQRPTSLQLLQDKCTCCGNGLCCSGMRITQAFGCMWGQAHHPTLSWLREESWGVIGCLFSQKVAITAWSQLSWKHEVLSLISLRGYLGHELQVHKPLQHLGKGLSTSSSFVAPHTDSTDPNKMSIFDRITASTDKDPKKEISDWWKHAPIVWPMQQWRKMDESAGGIYLYEVGNKCSFYS